LEAQDRSIKDAGRDLAQAKAEKEAREREQGRLGARLEELWRRVEEIRTAALSPRSAEPQPDLPECFKPGGSIPAFSTVNALLAAQVTSLNALTTERDEARRAGSRLSGLYQANQALQSAAANNERERALTAEKLKTLSAALSERRQKGEQFLVSLEPLLAEARSPLKGLKPGTLLEEMDRMLAGTEAGIKTRREAREAATQELAAANALREEARRIREASIASLAEAAASLTSALASSPFAAALDAIDSAAIGAVVGSAVGSAEALRAAALDAGAETTLEAAIAGWQAARERLASQRAEIQRGLEAIRGELRVALAGAITPGQDGLEAELAALAGEQTVAEAAREQAGGELAALKRDEELYRDAEARFRELSQKAGRLGSLAEDLAGRNPHKKAFDAWLLGRYLTEVAAYATARLERMSESRYSLFLDNAPGGRVEGGRGLTGLDLAVFDAYTGKCRPCATLSGGESFMASISLALGLSDSIQNRSGGVRLDAVFIDEGFGSLDEASLDRALIILDELRDTRMVGLISHVGEMRSRIPSRMEVIKSPEGSRILQ
jgi:exonuclease SbcC